MIEPNRLSFIEHVLRRMPLRTDTPLADRSPKLLGSPPQPGYAVSPLAYAAYINLRGLVGIHDLSSWASMLVRVLHTKKGIRPNDTLVETAGLIFCGESATGSKMTSMVLGRQDMGPYREADLPELLVLEPLDAPSLAGLAALQVLYAESNDTPLQHTRYELVAGHSSLFRRVSVPGTYVNT